MTTVDPFRGAAAVVTRADGIDAWHEAAIAVVDDRGHVTHARGDADLITFTRSAIKPLQALPLCLTGACDALAIDDEELALAAASHDGGDLQRDVAARLLAKAGARADQLQCGAHWPIGMRAAGRHPCAGEDRDPLRHNCSGKHAGFLAVARTLGVPPERYLDPDAAVQRAVRRAVADACELDEAAWSPPRTAAARRTTTMPLASLARAFKNLATRGPGGAPMTRRSRACARRCKRTRTSSPGRRASTTRSQRAFGGRALQGRRGGLIAIGFSDPRARDRVKVLDGGDRALAPSHGDLDELGLLDDATRRPRPPRAPDGDELPGHRTGAIVATGRLLTAPDSRRVIKLPVEVRHGGVLVGWTWALGLALMSRRRRARTSCGRPRT